VRSPSSGRRATILIAGAALTLGLSGCQGLCTGVAFFDAFFCRFNEAPHVVLKASPNPVVSGRTVTLDSSASSDDGTITSRTWSAFDSVNDLTDSGSSVTRTVEVPNGGTVKPSVTLTDDEGATATGSVDLVVVTAGPNRLPVASIDIEEDPPLSGQFTHFTGRWTDDGRIVRAEWDLDGLPGFEVDEQVPRGDTFHETRFTYATPGQYGVSFRVTDDRGGQATALVDIVVVPGQGPTAVLSIPSAPGGFMVGNTITLDATGSTDDGGVTEYRFDKDGNFANGFEYLDDEPPIGVTTTVLPLTPGPFTVGVRVFDAQRQRDDEYATIQVIGGRARVAAAPRPVRFSARLSATPTDVSKVRIVRRGNVRRVRGVAATGRFQGRLGNGRKRAPKQLRAVLRAPWRGVIDASFNARTDRRRVKITALARGACLRITLTDAPGRKPRGTFKVVGGSRLTAKGRFRLAAGARVSGTVRARLGRARALRGACAMLAG
jgi:PKD domain-containing protein